ncbi:DUF4892 domain-containing protein [Marinobacter sp. CA1]|uniref:DUF4892 domain-containing protein n=1 Tax=Marinobacter sp. CA1 TaxID=2817656 RepID=UPI001D09500D|nr:DUF4892 domain-containing protein [Marinobacter sp. CA1]
MMTRRISPLRLFKPVVVQPRGRRASARVLTALGLLLGLIVPLSLQAQTVVPAFPLASVEAETEIVSPAHLVLLSRVREVNDRIRSESLARVPVNGEGQLLKIAEDSNREDARAYYFNQLKKLNAQILYQCEGRSCGRSSVWANRIFRQSILYGRDANQDYLVAAVQEDASIHLVLVYTVTRGNLTDYVWVEQLRLGEGADVPGLDLLSERVRGPIVVPWQGGITYRFEWDSTDRRQVTDWASGADSAVVITAHSSLADGETLEVSMARASEALEAMSSLLQKSGISREQQVPIVVGPAVSMPTPDRSGDRIEIVVISAP